MADRYVSDVKDASPLGQPLHFEYSGRTAQNRLLKAAMSEQTSSWDPVHKEKRGVPSKNVIRVYERWGEGQFGLCLTGNIMVDYDQLEARGNLIVPLEASYEGERFEAFKELAAKTKAHGSLLVGQVSHPGRQVQAKNNPDPISASDVQLEGNILGMTFAKPHAASLEEIKDIIARFTHAAEYLSHAGFDGIQLHGAHGYLLAQFLSQTTNKRTDQYGGSLRNRARIILEIAESVHQKVPASFIVGIKINSVEFQKDGFTAEEAKELCTLLEEAKFDFVELSGGTYQSLAFKADHKRDSTRKREAFFLEFADLITPSLHKTKSYVTGGFNTLDGMVGGLKTVDGIGLGRSAAQEPLLAKDLLEGKITGVIHQKVDQDNFGLASVIAGTQMTQIGKDQQPIDMSKQENVDAFFKDVAKWSEKMASGDDTLYGYPDIESAPITPYHGSAA